MIYEYKCHTQWKDVRLTYTFHCASFKQAGDMLRDCMMDGETAVSITRKDGEAVITEALR